MERLAYTDQKNSNSKKTKKGKLPEQLDLLTILRYAKDAAIGVIMGIGSFMVLITTFGLSWHHSDWPNGTFTDGLVYTWNLVAKHLAAEDGVFLKQLVSYDEENGFFLFVVLLFLVVIGILLSLSRNRWFAILYVLLLGLPSVIWGLHPSVLAVTILAGGVVLYFINSDVSDLRQGYRGLIYGVLLAAAAFVILCIPAVSHLADRPQALNDYREDVQQRAEVAYYGENPLHNGDLRVPTRKTGKGTALKVTMTTPDSLYLRGFVGDVLGDDGWETFSTATYYEDKDLFYWLKEDGFNGLGQISQSAALAEQGGKKHLSNMYFDESNSITIENVGADKRYAYIPYEISIDEVSDTKNWGDSFLTGGKLHKVKDYSFTSSKNKVSDWTDIASRFYANRVTVPEQDTYVKDESHYNAYIYDKYTYLSNEDRQVLDVAMGQQTGDQKRGHVEYNAAIKQIRQLLSTNFIYADTLTGHKKKYTVLENIFSAQTGYDAHFATAAVMMFRYYGIPARYVEGYLITPADVAMGQTSIDIPRENAHAWAEIYVDGIGFVPVEVCPNYYGVMQEADYSIGITSKNKNAPIDKSKQNGQDPNVKEGKTKTNAAGKKIPKFVLIILGILAGLLILALLAFLGLKIFRAIKKVRDRRQLFNKGDPREAVRAIYKRMEDIDGKPTQKAVDIGNKAAYSEFRVYEEDRQFMLSEYKGMKKQRGKKNATKDKPDKKSKKDKSKKDKSKKERRLPFRKKDPTKDQEGEVEVIETNESKDSKKSKLKLGNKLGEKVKWKKSRKS